MSIDYYSALRYGQLYVPANRTLRQTSEVKGFFLLRDCLLQRYYPRVHVKICAVFYRSKLFILRT